MKIHRHIPLLLGLFLIFTLAGCAAKKKVFTIYDYTDQFTGLQSYRTSGFSLRKKLHSPYISFKILKEAGEYTFSVGVELLYHYRGSGMEIGNDLIILLDNDDKIETTCIETRDRKITRFDNIDMTITAMYAFYPISEDELRMIAEYGIKGIRAYVGDGSYIEDFAVDPQDELKAKILELIALENR